MKATNSSILWFRDTRLTDLALVGGKNASLGEMYQQLAPVGVRVPNGFAVTTRAWRALLDTSGLREQLTATLSGVENADQRVLEDIAGAAADLVRNTQLPAAIAAEIQAAWQTLRAEYGAELTVAVRSSATAEDLPDASFAGQHESFLNVAGEDLLDAVMQCYASLFTPRAIRYRIHHRVAFDTLGMSVGIMKMVRSDLGSSGVTFTLDTDSGHRGVVYTTATWGLGELLVKGNVEPDEFYVHKDRLQQGHRAIMSQRLGAKLTTMTITNGEISTVDTPPERREAWSLSKSQVLELADIALRIEAHYSTSTEQPMDIEWATEGLDQPIYITQARPETVASQRTPDQLEHYQLATKPVEPALVSGRAVGQQIATGRVRCVRTSADLQALETGEVLVAETTSPDWGSVMQRAAGIVTDHGGRTCHAAIVARELGVPAIVGCGDATERLRTGDQITLACHGGQEGHVYAGTLDYSARTSKLTDFPTKTRIMLNLGNPELALKAAMLPTDGVGLARMEFIIANHVRLHPMAACHPERLSDADAAEVQARSAGYDSPREYFISQLAEGIAAIAGAFYPRPVIVRLSDFKTNEYARLIGGTTFEPTEANPMLGFRGAARYSHPAYQDGFALECLAIKRVRETMGFDNVQVMVPFCRRVSEGKRTLVEMHMHGLIRSATLKIYLMCEIPNNVISIDAFAEDFDGFSIGSNDLTQLTLGVDRDSELMAFEFDERDPGVLEMLRLAVEGAHRNNRTCSICGQAPSDYPEVAELLVRQGIDAISLNPDAVLTTRERIARLEAQLG